MPAYLAVIEMASSVYASREHFLPPLILFILEGRLNINIETRLTVDCWLARVASSHGRLARSSLSGAVSLIGTP